MNNISRNLGRMGEPIAAKASCCLWQLDYYNKKGGNVKQNCEGNTNKSELGRRDLDAGAHGG